MSEEKKKWEYEQTERDWMVRGSYDYPGNIEYFYKDELVLRTTVPTYKIWNYAAHLTDHIPDLEKLRESQLKRKAAESDQSPAEE